MPYVRQIVAEKANIINHNKKIYGTFAEIGAGQEVVNYFFKAGLASQTIAKSMSAYDMTFSDLIYGQSERYVCEKRLSQMLNHEYSLLENRLKKSRGSHSCFFAFADTVAVSTLKKNQISNHHGWMGLRFQSQPQTKYNEILLHLNLKDRTRLQQYEVLGVLGVNLIHTAFYIQKTATPMIQSLVDNFEKTRVEIDVLKCKGPCFKNINTTQLNLKLLDQNLTNITVFNPEITAPLDSFYSKSILLYSEEKNFHKKLKTKYYPFEVRKNNKKLSKLKSVIVHNCNHWHELKNTLRQYTDKEIILYLSSKELAQFLNEKAYSPLNIIQALGLFFDKKTKILTSANPKKISSKHMDLIKNLIKNNFIIFK